jgi:hypothetical protein
VIRTELSGSGHRHVVTEADVRRFISLLPDWAELSRGLHEIVLAEGGDADGWYQDGTVALCAWYADEELPFRELYMVAHRPIFERLGVRMRAPEWEYRGACPPSRNEERWFGLDAIEWLDDGRCAGYEYDDDGRLIETHELSYEARETHAYERTQRCRFTPVQARAFQLLHVFLHELGHHRDAVRAPHVGWIVRGESYAEQYANRYAGRIWERYAAAFGLGSC